MDYQYGKSPTTRRQFLSKTASLSTAALGASAFLGTTGCHDADRNCQKALPLFRKNSVILFQGDSITDAGRDRKKENVANDSKALGRGYASLISSHLLMEYPGQGWQIYNRGNSGNKVFQLADRWEKDCFALEPDVLSILIGVNDIWHGLGGLYQGTVKKYEKDYTTLLQRTRKKFPKITLVICEPFVLRCGAVNDKWFPEFDRYRAVARKMATNFQGLFVPFQTMFDQAARQLPAAHWAGDGVHPSMAGASLMAQKWLEIVGKAAG